MSAQDTIPISQLLVKLRRDLAVETNPLLRSYISDCLAWLEDELESESRNHACNYFPNPAFDAFKRE